MICENCKQRHANVTVTQLQDGQKFTHHYCDVCASQFQAFQFDTQEEPLSLQQFITNWFGAPVQQFQQKQKQQPISCSNCGFTYRQFLKHGKFGCSECYNAFSEQLPAIFEKLHGSTTHTATYDIERTNDEKVMQQIEALREDIQQAIAQERFEDAAAIRDQIKALEISLQGGASHES